MTSPSGVPDRSRGIAESLTPREWNQLVDLVVERIEDRIENELARRGRRNGTQVF